MRGWMVAVTLVTLVGCAPAQGPAPTASSSSAGVPTPAVSAPTSSASPRAPSPSAAPTLAPARARAFERAFASGDVGQLRSVIALPPGETLDASSVRAWSSAPLAIDESTFEPQGGAAGQVDARLGADAWRLYLTLHEGRWMIVATERR